jgi:hypothetical protein
MHGTVPSLETLAAEIKREHAAVTEFTKKGIERAIRAGELLTAAKKQLKHGEWLPWLAEHVQIPSRTAQHYMRLARHKTGLASQIRNLAHLTVEAAVALTRKPKKSRDPAETEPARVTDDDTAPADDADEDEDTDTDTLVADLVDEIEEALDPLREKIKKVIEEGVPADRAAVGDALREHVIAVASRWVTELSATTGEKRVPAPTKH